MKPKTLQSIIRLTIILTLFSFNSFAQNAGDLDSTFGVNGIVKYNKSYNSYTTPMNGVIQFDGKIISYSTEMEIITYKKIFKMTRFNIDGTIDLSFGTNGSVIKENFTASSLKLTQNGSILIGGFSSVSSSYYDHLIVMMYTSNGTIATDYGEMGYAKIPSFGLKSKCDFLEIAPDGYVTIIATSTDDNINQIKNIIKLDTIGFVDSTFAVNGFLKFNLENDIFEIDNFIIQNDGKMLFVGYSYALNKKCVIRLDQSGLEDNMFNRIVSEQDSYYFSPHSLISFEDNSILLLASNESEIERGEFYKYNSDGVIDTLFGNKGKLITPLGNVNFNILVKNNKFLFSGYNNLGEICIAKYNFDGSPDFEFGEDSYIVINTENYSKTYISFNNMNYQNDEKIILFGIITDEITNGTSSQYFYSSCVARHFIKNIIHPFPNQQICSITCDSITQKNAIIWEKPLNEGIQSFNIWKESGSANNYVNIGNVPFDSLSKFIDVNSDPKAFSYKYKISVVDTLNQESALSDFQRTMQLVVNQNVGGGVNLIWTDYMISSTEYADSYTVYRGNGNNFTPIYTNVLPSGSGVTTMLDDGQKYSANFYKVGYKLKNSCSPSKSGITEVFSNTVEVIINDIENANLENEISIYPTLVENLLTVKTNNSKITKIEILNSIGQTLISSNIEKTETFDFSKMPKGIYFVKVLNENSIFTKKVIKH